MKDKDVKFINEINLKIKGFGNTVMISVLTSSTSCAYLHITVTARKTNWITRA